MSAPRASSPSAAWISAGFGALVLGGALLYAWKKEEEAKARKPADIVIQQRAPVQYGAQPAANPGAAPPGDFETELEGAIAAGEFRRALTLLERRTGADPAAVADAEARRREIMDLAEAAADEAIAKAGSDPARLRDLEPRLPAATSARVREARERLEAGREAPPAADEAAARRALAEAEGLAREGRWEEAARGAAGAAAGLPEAERDAVAGRAARWLRLAPYAGLVSPGEFEGVAAGDLAALEAAVQGVLDAPDDAARARALAAFDALRHAPPRLAAAALLRAAPWNQPGGEQNVEVSPPGGRARTCAVSAPDDYLPARLRPLVVFLLPGRTPEAARMAARAWRQELGGDLIVAVPDPDPKAGWGPNRLGEEHLPALLRELRRRYLFDPDRVVLAGISAGAHGAWFQAMRYGDRYAACVALSGTPYAPFYGVHYPDWGDNLNLAPTRALQGLADELFTPETARRFAAKAKERGWRAELMEFAGAGHEGAPAAEAHKAYLWALAQRRDPYPRKFHWTTDHLHTGRCSWVEIAAFPAGEKTLRISFVDDFGQSVEKRDVLETPARVDVEVSGQDIRLTAARVARLRLYWNAAVADLTRPVTVRVNGREAWKGVPETGVRFMLEEAARTGRRDLVFAGRVELEVK